VWSKRDNGCKASRPRSQVCALRRWGALLCKAQALYIIYLKRQGQRASELALRQRMAEISTLSRQHQPIMLEGASSSRHHVLEYAAPENNTSPCQPESELAIDDGEGKIDRQKTSEAPCPTTTKLADKKSKKKTKKEKSFEVRKKKSKKKSSPKKGQEEEVRENVPLIRMMEKELDNLDETTTTTEDEEDETQNGERNNDVGRGEKAYSCIEILDAEACNDQIYNLHKNKSGMETESDWYRMIEDEEWGCLYDSLLRKQQEKSPVSKGALMLAGESSSVLHLAAWKAPTSLMLLLLEVLTSNPSSISRTKKYLLSGDAHGNTPLHLACASLNFTTEPQITTPNGNVVARSKDGIDFSVIKNLLLLAPASLEMCNNDDDSPLHLMIASEAFRRNELNVAVEAAAEEATSSLLFMAPHLAVVQNDGGCTILHVALANRCHERVLIQLITLAPESITVADHRGMLPLHYVAAFGRTPSNVASYLVEQCPETICCQTVDGDTPLHLLIMHAKGIVQERWEQENAELSECVNPCLSYHVDRQTTKLAELLVGTGVEQCSPLLVQNNEDMTPLHCCAAFDTPVQLTRILMNQSKPEFATKASVLPIEETGSTPLHLAIFQLDPSQKSESENDGDVQKENTEANIVVLATHEACGVHDTEERTPLMLALQQKKLSSYVIKNLIEARPESVGIRTSKKLLPIHFACQNRKMKASVVKGTFASCVTSFVCSVISHVWSP